MDSPVDDKTLFNDVNSKPTCKGNVEEVIAVLFPDSLTEAHRAGITSASIEDRNLLQVFFKCFSVKILELGDDGHKDPG